MDCVPGVEQPRGYPLGPAAVGLGVSDVVEVDSQLPLAPDEGDVLAVDHHHVVAAVVQRVVDGLQGDDWTNHMSCLIAMAENHAVTYQRSNCRRSQVTFVSTINFCVCKKKRIKSSK